MLDYSENGRHLLITIQTEEANLHNAVSFKEELKKLLDKGVQNNILNFERVQYIDSSFLGALVASLKYAIPRKQEIALVGLKKDILNLLQLIRMDKVFHIYPSFEEAMEKYP